MSNNKNQIDVGAWTSCTTITRKPNTVTSEIPQQSSQNHIPKSPNKTKKAINVHEKLQISVSKYNKTKFQIKEPH